MNKQFVMSLTIVNSWCITVGVQNFAAMDTTNFKLFKQTWGNPWDLDSRGSFDHGQISKIIKIPFCFPFFKVENKSLLKSVYFLSVFNFFYCIVSGNGSFCRVVPKFTPQYGESVCESSHPSTNHQTVAATFAVNSAVRLFEILFIFRWIHSSCLMCFYYQKVHPERFRNNTCYLIRERH